MAERSIETARPALLIAAKSVWHPPVRREHATAILAAEAGHPVCFSERPMDVRAVRDPLRRRDFFARLHHPLLQRTEVPGVQRLERAVLVPGHRSPAAARLAGEALRAGLAHVIDERSCALVNLPWEWPAISSLKIARRSFGVADDWYRLVPDGQRRLARYYRQITEEADSIVVANAELAEQFPGREVTVIPNGVFEQHIGGDDAMHRPQTMIYIGTLSERFDADLVLRALALLPDWQLDLVGACQYAGLGDQPARELREVFALGARVRWHGQMERAEALELADRASVALIPNRAEQSHGQDSMKLYDYAARGLPIVASHLPGNTSDLPPGTVLTSNALDFADALIAAQDQPPALAAARRDWARTHSWTTRWPAWSRVIFGS